MNYYHIDKEQLKILSGPHSDRSTYVKKLTSCGNPELLNLSGWGLVLLVYPELSQNQRYTSARTVYQDRVEAGVEEIPTEEIQETALKNLEASVEQHIFSAVHAKGYDSTDSLSKYMARPNSPWYAECVALGDWIDACWIKCHEVMNAVLAGERAVPTAEELLAELPGEPS